MITAKDLESLLKNTLKAYAEDYNRINPKDKIDFNTTFTLHKFKASDIEGYDKSNEKFDQVTAIDGKDLFYFRISKTLLDKKEKRVIFTSYRPSHSFKKDAAHRMLLLEAVKHMMIGGLEYAEAIYRMKQAEQEKEEKQKEPQGNPV